MPQISPMRRNPRTQTPMNLIKTSFAALLIVSAVFATALVSGCVYKADVHQGNIVDEETRAQLRIGMRQEDVKRLLGTPLVVDPFHGNRWDYYTWSKTGNKEHIKKEQMTLIFEQGILAKIE